MAKQVHTDCGAQPWAYAGNLSVPVGTPKWLHVYKEAEASCCDGVCASIQ